LHPIIRREARVIVVDERHQVLLFQGVAPHDEAARIWITVGGAVESTEDLRAAASRELREETGFVVPPADLGDPVATTAGDWAFRGKVFHSDVAFFWLDTHNFEPSLDRHTDAERELLLGWRWWALDKLRSSGETVYPVELGEFVERLLAEGPPGQPARLTWT
jgi:8-oxo-dGTP pyrophosphatase MutT (NUDIX family)